MNFSRHPGICRTSNFFVRYLRASVCLKRDYLYIVTPSSCIELVTSKALLLKNKFDGDVTMPKGRKSEIGNEMDYLETAINLVRERNPDSKNFKLDRTKPFLDGEALYIRHVDEDDDEIIDLIYREGSKLEYLLLPEDVVEKVNEQVRRSPFERLFTSIVAVGGITGLLALLMTCVVAYLAIRSTEIPKILEQLIVLAFGFYFGNVKRT